MRFFNLSTPEGKVFWIVILAIVIVFASKAFEPSTAILTREEAYKIAGRNPECRNALTTAINYNSDTRTWWIDLDIDKEGCAPACVVNERTKKAEINWRCTGLIE